MSPVRCALELTRECRVLVVRLRLELAREGLRRRFAEGSP